MTKQRSWFKHLWFKCLSVAGVLTLIVIGVWWWQWQAPYRTLTFFLNALYQGDIDTLYAISLPRERELGVTKELIERTYFQFIKPALLDKYQLVRIQRIALDNLKPELWIRQRVVPFLLWYRDSSGKENYLYVSVVYPPNEQGWRIAFSYFVYRTARMLSNENEFMTFSLLSRLGYDVILGDLGGVLPVRERLRRR